MKGWKTWLAAACTAGLGIVTIMNGDTMSGLQQIAGAMALVGLGHKLEKLMPTSHELIAEYGSVLRDSQEDGPVR